MITNRLIAQLQDDEGFRKMPYFCTAGALTIGYGYNLDENELAISAGQVKLFKQNGISQKTAVNLLIDVLIKREKTLQNRLPWLSKLSPARRDVFMNMAYQLGERGFFNFNRTLAAAQRGDYAACADYMLQSRWALQTPNRAKRLAKQMKTGEYA